MRKIQFRDGTNGSRRRFAAEVAYVKCSDRKKYAYKKLTGLQALEIFYCGLRFASVLNLTVLKCKPNPNRTRKSVRKLKA